MTISLMVVVVVGLFLGVYLNRCIRRLPMESSLVWPVGGYCERCWQRISWHAYWPIVGWFLLGGRCQHCRAWLPWRGIVISVLTASGLAGLYWLHVIQGGIAIPIISKIYWSYGSERLFALFVFHALLFCFLLVATFTDFDFTLIPLSITNTGVLFAMVLGTFWYIEVRPIPLGIVDDPMRPGLPAHPGMWFNEDLWKVWFGTNGVVPPWLESLRSRLYWHWQFHWTKYLGFATGVFGYVVGRWSIGIVRWVCSAAFNKEAMGIGDLDLLGMIGAFLGWQMALISFALSWIPAIVIGMPMAVLARDRAMPFGPYLAMGAVGAMTLQRWVWPYFSLYFQSFQLFLVISTTLVVLLGVTAFGVQLMKRLVLNTVSAGRLP